jgi:sugar phosphate isomerase/epimerase
MRVGFISANLVARASGYDGTEDWGYHDELTRERTDLADVREWLDEVAALGFDGVSVWSPHCWYHDADAEDAAAVREAAAERGLEIYAYAGSLGVDADGEREDPAAWRRTFETAAALGADHLAGSYGPPSNRDLIHDLVAETGVGFAFENHPESSAAEMYERIEGYEDCMGFAFDTGWAGTQGFDAPETVRELGEDLTEIHLKDVRAAGSHETCALGEGVVDVWGVLDALEEIGYDGWLSVEHEPYDRDPMPEVETSLQRVRERL